MTTDKINSDITFRSEPKDAISDAILRLQKEFPGFVYTSTSSITGTGSRDRSVPNDILVQGYDRKTGRTLRARVTF